MHFLPHPIYRMETSPVYLYQVMRSWMIGCSVTTTPISERSIWVVR